MKRRIVSMLLVVVMLALTLVSCGYSYAKDDMTQYATFDKAAFLDGLTKIVVKDGAFTTDESTRELKVLDNIYATLLGKVDAASKTTEGKPAKYDQFYYNYYCTFTKDGVDYVALGTNMKESGAKGIQLGLTTLKDADKLISDAILALDIDDIAAYIYKTDADTANKTVAGDKVYISYTRAYTKTTGEGSDAVSTTVKENANYKLVTIGTAGGTAFLDKLIDKKFGEKFRLEGDIKEMVDGEEINVTYSDITIHWAVDAGEELVSVKYTPTSTSKVYPDYYTAGAEQIDLKDIELTYHVYPVYYKEVSEFNATSVLKEIFGKSLSASSLPLFEGDAYKTLIGDLSTLLSDLVTLKKDVETAQKSYDTAKKAEDEAGSNATDAQKTATTTALESLNTAKGKVTDKETAIGEKITAIFAIDTEGDGEDNLTTEQTIVKEYREKVYKSLEDAYNNEIKYAVAAKIYELIESDQIVAVSSDKLPEKAVDEAYDLLFDEYKATFYTEDNETTKKSYYSEHNGDFKAFLMEETGTKTYAAAKEAVRAEAKKSVIPVVKIYAVAQALELVYTDKEYNEELKDQGLGTYEDYYGATNLKTAEQIDKILDYYLELDDEKLEKDDDGNVTKINYKEVDGVKLLPYTRITYTATVDGTVTE